MTPMRKKVEAGSELDLIDLIRRLGLRVLKGCNRALGPDGITWAQFLYLQTMHEGRAETPSQIARLFEVDTGAITRLTDRLERGGFLQRRVSQSDRRSIRVELTPEGRDLLEAVLPLVRAQSRRFCRRLSAEERSALASLLRKLMKPRPGKPQG